MSNRPIWNEISESAQLRNKQPVIFPPQLEILPPEAANESTNLYVTPNLAPKGGPARNDASDQCAAAQ